MNFKKLTFLLISVIMLFTALALTASAYDENLADSVTENYQQAKSLAGRRSFYGNCNLATAYQLQAMGIYDGGLDFSGSGKEWYYHFKDETKTSGGYNVVTISGKNCLYDLVEKYGNEIYDIVYSLGTGGTSGSVHSLYIRAIINGEVYFADSFGCPYNGVYYSEGTGTVLPLEKFVAAYKRMNGDAYGCVYFTKSEANGSFEGSQVNPGGWENTTKGYTTGDYIVTASMLRIRAFAGTDYESLGLIPNGTRVIVSEVAGKWGKITYDGISGWICLDYTALIAPGSLKVNSVKASCPYAFNGTSITWVADVQGGSGSYFYAFYIYKNGEKVYNGTLSGSNSLTYSIDTEGTYEIVVSVSDSNNNKTEATGESVLGIGDVVNVLFGDADGDGNVSAADARLALRMAAHIELLVGKSYVCADMDKNGVINSADARLVLRKAAGLKEE